ncbi:MAG: translation initiation factor IF-2 [Kofleriaceae bacterium]
MRVYEIAREVGIPNKDLLAKIRALGLEVNNHMSSLDADDVARIKRSLEKEKQAGAEPAQTQRLSSTVLRRRSTRTDDQSDGDSAETRSADRSGDRAVADRSSPRGDGADERGDSNGSDRSAHAERAAERPVLTITPVVRRRPPEEPPAAPPPAPIVVKSPEPAAAPATATPVAPAPTPPAPPAPPAAPVVVEPAVATSPAAAPAATAEVPAPAARPADGEARPKSRVFVAGPQVVGRAGEPAPVAPPAPPATPASTPLPPRVTGTAKPREVVVMSPVVSSVESARSRFEQELERARARTAEREVPAREDGPAQPAEPEPQRDPSRPAVGTVITLPPRIKITERSPVAGRPAPNATPSGQQIRGRYAQQQKGGPGGSRGDFGKKKLPLGKKGKQTQLTTPAEHKRVIRIEDTIAVADLARSMGIKAPEVLKKLWGMGMTGVNINASIDFDTAQILASEFGYEVQNVAFKEEDIFSGTPAESTALTQRSPVVTVMGHVDHGKTSLLDSIRAARVAAGEAGGITQHVAAYKVAVKGHGDIVFLDTPGHEAFTEMRARGAQATDIVVLVVASNDGVMPQTLEALAHAKDAKVTIIVAVNKCDLPDAQPERVRQQLADHGLIPEEWGGDTIYINVSALKGEGIEQLLESIAVTAEVLELKANADRAASGLVIEARLDRNRGPMATILVQEGTLRVGDIVVAGRTLGRVRALLDDRGELVKEAGPSTPVELLGLDGVPEAGDAVNVADDEKVAKQVVEHRRQAWRKRELASTAKVSLENLMERINEGEGKELKIVLKADVQGSAEALRAALVKQSTDKVRVNVISAAVGGVTESDVNLAKAGGAIIVGFHVRPAGKSSKLAEQEGVQIRLYDIIYDALDEVKAAMAGLLAPIKREVSLGKLEVRDTFAIPKVGTVGGCMVVDGKITRRAHLRIIRDAIQVYEGKIGSLRRFKEDVGEVQQGYECGVMIAGWNELKQGDVIEAYEVVEEAAKL